MAQQFLSQDEVDALLEGVTGESQHPDQEAQDGQVRNYDLASQERIVRGRMPTLEIVNERFARNFRIGLFNFMRRSPEISIGPVKVQRYSAFLRNIVVPTNINIMQMGSLRGNSLIICDPKLVFCVIDNLFGGTGRYQTRIEGRDFSPTEQRIILRLVEVICEEYKKAWAGIYPLSMEYNRSEMHTQFANIATPGEIVVCTTFTIEIGEASGELHFCTPYATFEPIRDVLYSSLQGDQQDADRRWVKMLTRQVQSAEVELVAELAHADATVKELMQMKAGDFLELRMSDLLEVKVDGVPVFESHYGTLGGHYAVKINRFLTGSDEPSLLGD